jgi:pilus assembly protein Flp/PilA
LVGWKSGNKGVFDMTMIKNLLTDTSGASAAEYALILAIVGTGIAVAAYTLGGSISNAMNKASNCISQTPSATGC